MAQLPFFHNIIPKTVKCHIYIVIKICELVVCLIISKIQYEM